MVFWLSLLYDSFVDLDREEWNSRLAILMEDQEQRRIRKQQEEEQRVMMLERYKVEISYPRFCRRILFFLPTYVLYYITCNNWREKLHSS